MTRQELIEAAREAAASQEEPLTKKQFLSRTGITEWQINRLFPKGRWTEVRNLAGIDRHPLDRRNLSDDELLSAFHSVVEKVGDIPTWSVFNATASISADTVRRRFGGLQQTVQAYRSWLEANHPTSELLNMLRAASRHQIPTPAQAGTYGPSIPFGRKVEGPQFGPPIDFRGLRHAPLNEQGVVYLFGMLSYELGFLVEAVQSGFPDCVAKRQVQKDRWQHVRIEFEYRSSNFRDHRHDPAGADLIVCWAHDWSECPIDVLELRKVLDDLDG